MASLGSQIETDSMMTSAKKREGRVRGCACFGHVLPAAVDGFTGASGKEHASAFIASVAMHLSFEGNCISDDGEVNISRKSRNERPPLSSGETRDERVLHSNYPVIGKPEDSIHVGVSRCCCAAAHASELRGEAEKSPVNEEIPPFSRALLMS